MKVYIVTTGNEIMQGIIVDSNSAWLADKCTVFGHEVVGHLAVGDDQKDIGEALKLAAKHADCVLVSGGLGPTVDDITVESAAKTFNVELQLDEESLDKIKAFFERVGRPMADTNKKQALIPEGGKALPNNVGTAPGIQVNFKGTEFFFLPGVPKELFQIFEDSVMPWLKERATGFCETKIMRCFGLPEASIDDKLTGIDLSGCVLSFRVKFPEILLKLVCRSDDLNRAKTSVESASANIKKRLGEVLYAEGSTSLPAVVGRMLSEKNMTLAAAESCTGGLISSLITDVSGSSGYFDRAVVSYSNASKRELLGVDESILEAHGAVSKQAALAMAEGVRKISQTSIGISVTGIAGPTGGTPTKPVGTIFMAYATEEGSEVFPHKFGGDRDRIKLMTAMTAINMVRLYLIKQSS